MTEPLARLEVSREAHDQVLVTLTGEVDLSNSADVHARIAAAASSARVTTIDLRAVTYLDSQGLRVLAQLARQAQAEQRHLQIVAPSRSIAGQVLHITGLTDHLTVVDTPAHILNDSGK